MGVKWVCGKVQVARVLRQRQATILSVLMATSLGLRL